MAKKKNFDYCAGKKYDGMMGRCYRPSDKSHRLYGERGIKVCGSWIEDINNFKIWLRDVLLEMGISEEDFVNSSSVYQLDRINTDGHYTPDNCRLSSPQKNTRNRRVCRGKTVVSAEGTRYEF